MKASELRIGNLLHRPDLVDGELRTETVISIGEKVMMSGPIKVLCPYEDLTPIPLTEEWVKRFGFYDNDISVNGQQISVAFEAGEALMWGQDGCTSGHAFHAPCKYVHQLQNLYFALTGEELQLIKESHP